MAKREPNTALAPAALYASPAHAPLLDLISDQLITADTLAGRWGYTVHHMATLRRQQREPAWVELPTGGIRYRLSHIVGLELFGQRGPFGPQQIELLIASTPDVPDQQKHRVLQHIQNGMAKGGN